MHKQYAVDMIEVFRKCPKRWMAWAGEYQNSTRFITIHLLREFNLRHKRHVVMLRAIYARYGLDFDFSDQAKRAEDYFSRNGTNNAELCHVTISAAKVLAEITESQGLDGFVDCLDGELDAPWQWEGIDGSSGDGELMLADRNELCAVPTLGGILSDLGLTHLSKRFPDTVLLPVSKALSEAYFNHQRPSWMVVNYGGQGVAVTPQEAQSLGLTEAPNWVPDLSGVPIVPCRSDFDAIEGR